MTISSPLTPTKLEDSRRFIARVLPWTKNAYQNLHWFHAEAKPNGKYPMCGTAAGDLTGFLDALEYRATKAKNTRDIYFCLSSQRVAIEKVGANGRPYFVAKREAANAVELKALWLDLDIGKKDEKGNPIGYQTTKEAAAGLTSLLKLTGLPKPTATVRSGSGGSHVYWILANPMPVAEWQLYANALVAAGMECGLLWDSGCTSDCARILRAPDTLNHKSDPPNPVTLHSLQDYDYPNEQILDCLKKWVVTSKVNRPVNPSDGEEDEFSAGIEAGATPRNIERVAEQCAWLKDTLANGGKGNDNLLWFLSLRTATFCSDTDAVGHALSSGHGDYHEEETQQELERLKRDRQTRASIGFPSCKAIHQAGATQCAGCQHLALGKSPLNLPGVLPAPVNLPVVAPNGGLPDLPGGVYEPEQALAEVSKRFAFINRNGELSIVHRTSEGKDETLSEGDFNLYLANVYVSIGTEDKPKVVHAASYWLHHANRPVIRRTVFKPHAAEAPDEYNFWRGFGVEPMPGTDKLRRLFRHTWRVICRGDKAKFQYLMRWLAWAVQNPDENPETVIVLQSRGEGSGKTTLSDAMRRIFGQHGTIISDPEQIIGRHVDHLEFKAFVMIEEALFAGDPKEASRVRSRITSATISINPKHRKAYDAPNRMHAVLTTNHDWAVQAGKNARRWFVCEVSEDATFNKDWFTALNDDLNSGGLEQLLNFLLKLKLGDWHPRKIVRTEELARQQLLSANSVEQWLWACAENGEIPTWLAQGGAGPSLELGKGYWTATLHSAYCGYIKHTAGGRIEKQIAFGSKMKAILKKIGGYNRHMRENGSSKRAPGYFIPEAPALRHALVGGLGIRIDRKG
jgi:hypothetical protein